jgi:hypothetical protein
MDRKGDSEAARHRVDGLRRFRGEARQCLGARNEVDEKTEGERTRIVICSRGDEMAAADRTRRLEEALERIRGDEHLSPEHRARVEAALQGAIARLRETN